MTLRPEYALGHSAYNDFLFASLGPDAAGTELTVLSALTRLGLDPWAEAAQLADMPRHRAAKNLAAIIARLPPATWAAVWAESEPARIAERLVAALPSRSAPAVPPPAASPRGPLSGLLTSGPMALFRGAAPTNAGPAAGAERTDKSMKARYPLWLMWGALAVAFYFVLVQMTPDRNLEPAARETTSQR